MRQYRYDIIQNSDEWYEIKLGKFSASITAELLMAKTTKGYTDLIDKIVEERITEEPTDGKKFGGNGYTDRGHEYEPIAREDYEFRSFNDVKLVGVVQLSDWVLCSPDGLIDDNGIHQIKCPIFKTQRKYLKIVDKHKDLSGNDLLKKISTTYYKQMQFELFCTGREYNVFTAWHPKLPPIDIIVTRDDELIDEIILKLNMAIDEVKQEIEFINNLK